MPSTPAHRMSKALKSELVPALNAAGFFGTFPRFRRNSNAALQFVSAQYDKGGTAFFLEFGNHPLGSGVTSGSEVASASELILEHVPFELRARLQARPGSMSLAEDWFQFGHFGDDAAAYTRLAATAAAMLPQVEIWLSTRQAGPNVSPNGP